MHKDSKNELLDLLRFCVLTTLSLVLGACLGVNAGLKFLQDECVTRGVAEWSVSDNGETSFKWLVEPKAEKVDKEI